MFTSNPFAELPALSQYDMNTGEWEVEKAPVSHIVDQC